MSKRTSDVDRTCKEQVSRLSAFPGYPHEEAGIRDLVAALAAGCRGVPDRARLIMDAIVDSLPGGLYIPTPADIRRLAGRMYPMPAQADPKCTSCHGSGWLTSDWLVSEDHTPDGGTRIARQRISERQAVELGRRIGAQADTRRRQMVYGAAEACGCSPGL